MAQWAPSPPPWVGSAALLLGGLAFIRIKYFGPHVKLQLRLRSRAEPTGCIPSWRHVTSFLWLLCGSPHHWEGMMMVMMTVSSIGFAMLHVTKGQIQNGSMLGCSLTSLTRPFWSACFYVIVFCFVVFLGFFLPFWLHRLQKLLVTEQSTQNISLIRFLTSVSFYIESNIADLSKHNKSFRPIVTGLTWSNSLSLDRIIIIVSSWMLS